MTRSSEDWLARFTKPKAPPLPGSSAHIKRMAAERLEDHEIVRLADERMMQRFWQVVERVEVEDAARPRRRRNYDITGIAEIPPKPPKEESRHFVVDVVLRPDYLDSLRELDGENRAAVLNYLHYLGGRALHDAGVPGSGRYTGMLMSYDTGLSRLAHGEQLEFLHSRVAELNQQILLMRERGEEKGAALG